MKVIEEPITVFRESGQPGLTLLMGGYRVALTMEEARVLVGSVRTALEPIAATSDPVSSVDPVRPNADPLAIVAKVKEQVISWAQIAAATEKK
jgi:hypothetical protein